MIALPQEELLVRLAGYDRVPETKLTRSLREPWQRGRPGWSQNGCWSLRAHATQCCHLRRDNRVHDSDRWDSRGVRGDVRLLHI